MRKMKEKFKDQYRILGCNIRFYRAINNYTLQKLSKKINIDATHLGRIENAKVGASLDIVFALADIFEIEPAKLFKDRYVNI